MCGKLIMVSNLLSKQSRGVLPFVWFLPHFSTVTIIS